MQSQQSLQQTKTNLASMVTELSIISQNKKIMTAAPNYPLYQTHSLPSEAQAKQTITQQSRLVNSYQVRLNQIENNHHGLKNAKQPELNLIVAAGLLGHDGDLGGSAFVDRPQYSVTLSFNYPIGNRTAKSNLDQSHLQKIQLNEEKSFVILQLQSSVAALLERLSQLTVSLTLHKLQIDSSQQKTQAEMRRYNQGRSELTFVLQSQDQEQQAKISYAMTAALKNIPLCPWKISP